MYPNGPSEDILANTQLSATHPPPNHRNFFAVWEFLRK